MLAVMSQLAEKDGIAVDYQCFVISKKHIAEFDKTVSDYNIPHKSTIHLVLRLGTSEPSKSQHKMTIALGGKIEQLIHADTLENGWLSEMTTVFNVRILNAATYRAITGQETFFEPISAQTYDKYDISLKLYEEPGSIYGDFSMVDLVDHIDEKLKEEANLATVAIGLGAQSIKSTSL